MLQGPISQGIVHGLKVTAVAIVAYAVWGMARTLCPDRQRAGIALAAVFTVVLIAGPLGQVAAIAIGALAGMMLCRSHSADDMPARALPVSHRSGLVAGLLYIGVLIGLPLLAWTNPSAILAVADAFYRAGALVFGGGHVVLPLLEAEVVQSGWVSANEFLAGYGAAQAVPGPLFTFAAYLGAVISPPGGSLFGATLALIMIFLPGMLLLVAVLPHWSRFRRWERTRAVMRGANAAVVGVLGAALYHPVWTSAILGPHEFALALLGFILLSVWRWPAWAVVLVLAIGGVLISM
jgi:chromate transporter